MHTSSPTAAVLAISVLACASPPDPARYRLAHSGPHWDEIRGDRVFEDLQAIYPAYFEVILDPKTTRDPDLRPVRDDLERTPVDRRNYDALNAVAIGYYELNHRAENDPGGASYLGDSFRAAKLLAIPWRAYGEVEAPALRDAILDFFEDAGSGEKLSSASTAPRLARIVGDLERKEQDPARKARIQRLTETLLERSGSPEPL